MELLCFGIAPVSLTKPFQKGWSCQDSNVLFGKVLWGLLLQIPKQWRRPPASLAYRRYWCPLPLHFDFLCGSIAQMDIINSTIDLPSQRMIVHCDPQGSRGKWRPRLDTGSERAGNWSSSWNYSKVSQEIKCHSYAIFSPVPTARERLTRRRYNFIE